MGRPANAQKKKLTEL